MPRKTGPKVEDQSENMKRINVTLGDSAIRKLFVLGGGNLSEGIRVAARVAYERYQDQPGPEKMVFGVTTKLTREKIAEAKAMIAKADADARKRQERE